MMVQVPMGDHAVPSFRPAGQNPEDGTLVAHVENVGVIAEPANNNGATTVKKFTITPTNQALFPWFAGVAAYWAEWELMGMLIDLKTAALEVTGSGSIAAGRYAVVVNYDPADPVLPNNFDHYLNYEDAVNGEIQQSLTFALECAPRDSSVKVLFVRNPEATAPVEVRKSDFAIVYIMTDGVPNSAQNQKIATLIATYEIRLMKPRIITVRAYWHYYLQVSSLSTSAYFGALGSPALVVGSTVTLVPTVNVSSIVLPFGITGYFRLTYYVLGNSGVMTNAIAFTLGSAITTKNLQSGANSVVGVLAGTTTGLQISVLTFKVDGSDPSNTNRTITISAGTLPSTGLTVADLWIDQLSDNTPDGGTSQLTSMYNNALAYSNHDDNLSDRVSVASPEGVYTLDTSEFTEIKDPIVRLSDECKVAPTISGHNVKIAVENYQKVIGVDLDRMVDPRNTTVSASTHENHFVATPIVRTTATR